MAKQKEREETTTQTSNQEGTQATQATAGQSSTSSSPQTGLSRRGSSAPALASTSPFAFMRRFSEEMDRLFEDFGFGRGWLTPSFGRDLWPRSFGELAQTMWSPQVEMFERGGQLVVRADLPGLTKDDVKVEVTDEEIILSGERRQEHEEQREGYYHSERSYGSFRRSIPLPEGVNADNAQATFRNGVLEVTMQAPQHAEQQRRGRPLEIREGSGGEEQTKSQAQTAGQK